MEGVEEGAYDEILGPDHGGGPDEVAAADASEAKAGHLGSEHETEVPSGKVSASEQVGGITHPVPSLIP